MSDIQVVQVGMCPITDWPNDYNWSDTDKHKCFGGHWEQFSGVGGVGDEIAMRMFFNPYRQYRSIKEKYPHLYFRHYSLLHPRSYDPNPLFNAGSILNLYEHNPYIDEVSYIDSDWVTETEYYKNGHSPTMNETEGFQWFIRCLGKFMENLQVTNNEASLYDIIVNEVFEQDEPTLYIDENSKQNAKKMLCDLPKPLIGIQVNKTANNIIDFLPIIQEQINAVVGDCTLVCVGTVEVPKRWLEGNIVSFSGQTSLLEGIALIDNLDAFFCMFSGLMYSAFIKQTPAVIWAEEEKGDEILGHATWYANNLGIDKNLNKFIIGDKINIEQVAAEISNVLKGEK